MDFSFRFADKETVEHRLNICDACEHKVLLVCSKCGCICAAKARKKILVALSASGRQL
jgi:hypothetical protein